MKEKYGIAWAVPYLILFSCLHIIAIQKSEYTGSDASRCCDDEQIDGGKNNTECIDKKHAGAELVQATMEKDHFANVHKERHGRCGNRRNPNGNDFLLS